MERLADDDALSVWNHVDLEFLRHVRDTKARLLAHHGQEPKVLARGLRNWEHFLACREAAPHER